MDLWVTKSSFSNSVQAPDEVYDVYEQQVPPDLVYVYLEHLPSRTNEAYSRKGNQSYGDG